MTKHLLAEVGQRLFGNGYEILPIRGKRPVEDDWTSIHADAARVAKWRKEYPKYNVGIQTRHTPAIDIDVYDAEVAQEIEAWCLENLGDAPVRIGQAPKRLLLFRTDEPFTKMKVTFVDGIGDKHAVEVLGEGQQFVAFGVHPDTKRPFEWVSIDNPLDLETDALPLLTRDDAARMLVAFEEIAIRHGWTAKSKAASRAADAEDDDEVLLTVRAPIDDLEDEDIRDALMLVPDAEDYDRWLHVGLALFHQYRGDEKGLELWHAWSETAHNYDAEAVDERWQTFDVDPDQGKAITFRTVLEWAKEGAKLKAKDDFARVKNMISTCTDVDDLFDSVAKKVAKAITYDHQLDVVAKLMQERANELDGVKRPIDVARKALIKSRSAHKASVGDKTPEWVSDFVWLENDDCFYSLSERKAISIRSYNARYDRHMLSPEDKALGRAIPEVRATDAALTTYSMKHVDGQVYLPACEQIVQLDDDSWRVNIYDDRSIPAIEEVKTKSQKNALEAVERHFEVLFPNTLERDLVISYLAYQVQCPGERINWAMLIQGAEGAGKTWMQNLMAGVIGRSNVGPVNPASLFAPFNGWAEGRKMIFVEEIRLRGHDRFEVLDKIKTNITNDTLEITRKGRDPYVTPNVASYVMFTNYSDALSLSDNDRRYFIVKTSFQVKAQIVAFRMKYPGHYAQIFSAVSEHPGVLRGWLMAKRLSPDFDPKGDAPTTDAKRHMRAINLSDEQESLLDLVEGAAALDCSEYLLNSTTLPDKLMLEGAMAPRTSALRKMLDQLGFVFLGRHKVGGEMGRYYTRRPDLFPNSDVPDIAHRIRRIMDGEEPEFL